jgi:HlyD family secretion protein
MLIIPDEDRLTIQARLQPSDIDQVKIGRPARLRLTAFSQQQTPEIDGTVVHIAGDITTDPKTGAGYYSIRVEMDPVQAKEKAAKLRFVPGMPVEVFFSTGDRTVLSYLAKPFTDQMYRAFREGGRTDDSGSQPAASPQPERQKPAAQEPSPAQEQPVAQQQLVRIPMPQQQP